MKGVLLSLPELRAAGFEIEAWCWDCEEGLPIDRVVKLPRIGAWPLVAVYAFSFWVWMRRRWEYQWKRKQQPDLVYAVAWYTAECDVAHVHFSPWDWDRRQKSLGCKTLRDQVEFSLNLVGMWWANRCVKRTTAKSILVVSDSVAADVRAQNPELNIRVLPNCYDAARFTPKVRSQYRDSTRAELGFSPDNKVFVFVSAGHYRRKGFHLAIEALKQVRLTQPQTRFMVIGGKPNRVAELQETLLETAPDWREWITFTGMVKDVERYLAAGDALLFPSYSEAFALVEVEAAACGLPLFLTRHHGSEMILEDGVNGRYVDFDPVRIAEVLNEFVTGAWTPSPEPYLKHAVDGAEYARRLTRELSAVTETRPVSLQPCIAAS